MPNREKLLNGVGSGGPDVVAVIVEDYPSPAIGSLFAGGRQAFRGGFSTNRASQLGNARRGTARHESDQKLASSRVVEESVWHGSAFCQLVARLVGSSSAQANLAAWASEASAICVSRSIAASA